MDITQLAVVVDKYGFPLAMVIVLCYFINDQMKKSDQRTLSRDEDYKKLLDVYIEDSKNNTKVIENNTLTLAMLRDDIVKLL